jgi:hypothetical protein
MPKTRQMVAMPPPAVTPVRPVNTVPPVAPPAPPVPVPQPSPMARPPVAPSSRVVPGVATGRGVVRTDTHNAANQVPAAAKHGNRGFKGK